MRGSVKVIALLGGWKGGGKGGWSAPVLGRWLGHDYIILLFRTLESAIQLSLLMRNNAQILTVECDIYDGMKITYEPSEEDYGWYCHRGIL